MVANPYSSALAGLGSQRSGAKKGLDLIYKAMRQNVSQFGKRLNTLDSQTAQYISNYGKDLQGQLAGFGKTALADVLGTAELGGPVDPAQRKYLSTLAGDDVGEFQGYGGSIFKGEGNYQKSLRGIDKQYVKDLMAAAVRERQARHAELDQNLLDYSSGLRTQSAMFDAQGQMLDFAQSQLGTPVGGGSAGITGRESPNVQKAMQFGAQQWGVQVGGWRAHGSVPGSDHPKGLAADYMVRSMAQGGQMAGYWIAHAEEWGVKYVIWNRMINTLDGRGWRPYNGPSPHTDHVHVSFRY